MSSKRAAPEEIRKLRQTLGMLQSEFAAMAMVCTRTVQRWEAPTTSTAHTYPSAAHWALLLHLANTKPVKEATP